MNADFFPEDGCPVRPTAVRSVLEIDAFGAPTACKIYLTYSNISSKPITAVKFRCRYSDPEGKDRGTFHAPDHSIVPPGGSRSHKWKREGGLHPNITGFQIRVLQVKYDDGSLWDSARMVELMNSAKSSPGGGSQEDGSAVQQSGGAVAGGAAPDSGQSQQSPFEQQPPAQGQTQPGYEQAPQQQSQSQEQGQAGYDKTKELPW